MSRCKECNACMFDTRVKFYEKYLCFLCDKCFKKKNKEEKNDN
jgi:hypothetical protein